MGITAITGKIGSGKSLKQLKYALDMVQNRRKTLVTNFDLNTEELLKYAALKKYGWLGQMIQKNQIKIVDASIKLDDLLTVPNSVVCLDEAGIFLNAYSKINVSVLYDLCQSRKFGADLVWSAQFLEQVHWQFRHLTQFYVHSNSLTKWDREMKRPSLIFKTYFHFDAEDYYRWWTDRKRSSYWRTRVLFAFKTEHGFIDKFDKQLFKCFDSFSRLDKQSASSCFASGYTCPLPKDYYFCNLELYAPELDPFSSKYIPLKETELNSQVRSASLESWQNRGSGLLVYDPSNHQMSRSEAINSLEADIVLHKSLVSEALEICRSQNMDAPYFASMPIDQIQAFIQKSLEHAPTF